MSNDPDAGTPSEEKPADAEPTPVTVEVDGNTGDTSVEVGNESNED